MLSVKVGIALCFWLTVLAYAASYHNDVPKPIRQILSKDYPGWELPKVDSEILKYWKNGKASPNVISGDFDCNSRKDYAVRIKVPTLDRTLVIAFLSKKRGFEKMIVDSEISDDRSIFLGFSERGRKGFNYEENKEYIYPCDTIEVVFFEKASSSYIFENGKFRRFTSSD